MAKILKFFTTIVLSSTIATTAVLVVLHSSTLSRITREKLVYDGLSLEGSEALLTGPNTNLSTEGVVKAGDLYVGRVAYIDSLNLGESLYVAGNNIVNESGRIPAINIEYFSSLDGSALTGIDADSLDGIDSAGFLKSDTVIDADRLDGIDSGSFLRADTSTTAGGAINITAVPGSVNVGGGGLYVNPSSATANYTLFGVAINGSERFKVDAEGDVRITGTLTFASTGSLTGLGLSEGSVIFADSSGALSQDNANLFWDDTNNRLGLGTTTPTGRLHSAFAANELTSTVYTAYFENLALNSTTDAIDKYGLYITSTGTFTGDSGTATNNYGLYIDTPTGADNNYGAIIEGGNVGIGTTTPSSLLHLVGTENNEQLIIAAHINQTVVNPLIQLTNSSGTELLRIHSNDARNVFIGKQAGNAINASGGNNGLYNTFVGGYAGDSTTTGFANVFLGENAGTGNLTGTYNVFVGTAAGDGSTNTGNTGIGHGVLGNASLSGAGNIALGYQAGDALTTGATNIIIGYDIDLPAVDSSNMLDIGNLIYATGLTSTGTTVSSGAVGIGETTPAANMTLDVAGRVQINLGGTQTSTALCGSHGSGGGASETDVEIVDCTGTPAADYMEFYPVEKQAVKGTVVVVGSKDVTTKKGDKLKELVLASKEYQRNVIGVVSDQSQAGDFNSIGYDIEKNDNPQPIALAGRVPVQIASYSSEIRPGDFVASSNENGRAMKADRAGYVIGKALESWSAKSGKETVMIFVSNSYYFGDEFLVDSQTGELVLKKALQQEEGSTSVENVKQSNYSEPEENKLGEFGDDSSSFSFSVLTEFLKDIVVEGVATFRSTVDFIADVTFGGKVKFKGTVTYENKDVAGFAKIKAGDSEVEVVFDQAHEFDPIIQITPQEIYEVKYAVVESSSKGFTISIDPVQSQDVLFAWSALSVKDATTSESAGTSLQSQLFSEVDLEDDSKIFEASVSSESANILGE